MNKNLETTGENRPNGAEKRITNSNHEVTDHYLITVDQFYAEAYDQRISRGECRVILRMEFPSANASKLERALSLVMGNAINVIGVKLLSRNKNDEAYYGIYDLRPGEDPEKRVTERANSYIGIEGSNQLLVFPKTK